MKGFARREFFVKHKLRNWQETGYEYYIISLKEITQKINRYLGGRQRIHRCQYITKGNGCKPPTPSFGTEEKAFVFLYSQIGCCILMYLKKKTGVWKFLFWNMILTDNKVWIIPSFPSSNFKYILDWKWKISDFH